MRSKSYVRFRSRRETPEPADRTLSTSRQRRRQRFLGQRNRPTIDPVLEVAHAAA